MRRTVGFIILVLMFAGCAGPKTVKRETPAEKKNEEQVDVDESFDPSKFIEDEIKIKESRKSEAQSNFDSSILQKTEITAREVDGYRVQICAVPDEYQARDIQKDAILKFNERVYLIYDSPYYKVRVGNCTTRYDADQLQKLAEEKGFADSWVVKTKVKPQDESK